MNGREIRVAAGETIFRQGEGGDRMFVIVEGVVRLYLEGVGGEHEVARFGAGEFFGELSLLSGAPRSATARAAAPAMLLEVGREAFQLMMQDDIGLVFRMMSALGRRLVESNAPRRELVDRLARIRVMTRGLARLAAATVFPRTIEATELAADLSLATGDLDGVLYDLAAQGVGRFADGAWTFVEPDDVTRLLAVLDRQTIGASGNGKADSR